MLLPVRDTKNDKSEDDDNDYDDEDEDVTIKTNYKRPLNRGKLSRYSENLFINEIPNTDNNVNINDNIDQQEPSNTGKLLFFSFFFLLL